MIVLHAVHNQPCPSYFLGPGLGLGLGLWLHVSLRLGLQILHVIFLLLTAGSRFHSFARACSRHAFRLLAYSWQRERRSAESMCGVLSLPFISLCRHMRLLGSLGPLLCGSYLGQALIQQPFVPKVAAEVPLQHGRSQLLLLPSCYLGLPLMLGLGLHPPQNSS